MSFDVTLVSGELISVDVNRVNRFPYKKSMFTYTSDAYTSPVIVEWDAKEFPLAMRYDNELLGYIDGTVFDSQRISLGYARKTDIMGNRWEIISTHGKLLMNREKKRERFSWKKTVCHYEFIADDMKSNIIDFRLIIGLVVEYWTPRLFPDSGSTG